MQVVTVGGPTKTGKSSVAADLYETFSSSHDVWVRIGGDFFRSLTSAVLAELDPMPYAQITPAVLDEAISKVVADDRLYDPARDWGDLHRPAVEEIVSTIGERKAAQEAASEWYAKTVQAAQAAGIKLLIVDGRNPRDHLANAGVSVDLDIFYDCSEEEAARRNLLALGTPYDDADLEFERKRIVERRRLDAERQDHPLQYPSNPVLLDIKDPAQAEAVVEQALQACRQGAPVDELPRTILFDNTHVPKDIMLKATRQLVQSVL